MSEPTQITRTRAGTFGEWYASGAPWVWMTGGAVALAGLLVVGLLALIAIRGLGHFWPSPLIEAVYVEPGKEPTPLVAQLGYSETVSTARLQSAGINVSDDQEFYERRLVKVANRDVYGADFRYLLDDWIQQRTTPEELSVFERLEWGDLYGYLIQISEQGASVGEGDLWEEFRERHGRARDLHHQIERVQEGDIGAINYALEQLRLRERRMELNDNQSEQAMAEIERQRSELNAEYAELQQELQSLNEQIQRDSITVQVQNGRTVTVSLAEVVRGYRPNAMGLVAKISFYFAKVWEFVSDEPREANTEGGVFPAIFGTVLMVMLMSVFVTPFGVVAALYLREYAKQGVVTRIIRIAVNNLAGVPSIVYGVFGLGFFVYALGGSIDELFFPAALPSPTFGTGGIFWASLTLALLTLPVVIVSTEEGLARIPRSLREASLALGATKAETLWKIVLPMSSPAMMTGLILAIARAAGEVAPLMLVGVVKLAPSLPLDGNFPYLHLDRKFMHLGFHIYDVGFQSPNVEAARPLVYATALLLVLVIVILNLAAVRIRNRLRERYRALEH
ncbi:phosphate ABC transporter permease PstA [uncultured Abyssibacter sp.]|uniref:phosphate ABC transporter permease PstA n=1 Tax=uncultured Abyssibacter sp. TaxID=2320202 RepID=UPI0032B20343